MGARAAKNAVSWHGNCSEATRRLWLLALEALRTAAVVAKSPQWLDQATLVIHTDSSHRRLVVTSCGGGDGDSGSGRPRGDAGQLLRTRGLWLMSSDQLTTVAAAGNEQAMAGPQLRDDVGANRAMKHVWRRNTGCNAD